MAFGTAVAHGTMVAMSERLLQIRERLDREVENLEARHAERLRCASGCADCCVDELTVFEVEARAIREHYPELLANGTPHAPGKCAFLDEQQSCRIYEQRPYVCRTQGLPLRWTVEGGEMRDICPRNETDEPIIELAESDCWTLGPYEWELAQLQRREGEADERITLRSLFAASRP